MQPFSYEFDHIRGVLDVINHKNTSIKIYKNETFENGIAYKMFKTHFEYINYLVCEINYILLLNLIII